MQKECRTAFITSRKGSYHPSFLSPQACSQDQDPQSSPAKRKVTETYQIISLLYFMSRTLCTRLQGELASNDQQRATMIIKRRKRRWPENGERTWKRFITRTFRKMIEVEIKTAQCSHMKRDGKNCNEQNSNQHAPQRYKENNSVQKYCKHVSGQGENKQNINQDQWLFTQSYLSVMFELGLKTKFNRSKL